MARTVTRFRRLLAGAASAREDAARRRLGIAIDPEARAAKVAAERVRLIYQILIDENYFYGISTIGVAAAGLLLASWSSAEHSRIWLWVLAVFIADLLLVVSGRAYQRVQPEDESLAGWGIARTAIGFVYGLAWGIGPLLVYRDGDPITALVPALANVVMLAGTVYSNASYLPAQFVTVFMAVAPGTIYLFLCGPGIERVMASTMAVSIPFELAISAFSSRAIGIAINNRLDIADLLERQRELVRQVQQSQAERTRFFGAASHDLRQPLHALGFYASLLASSAGQADLREITARIADCIHGLDRQFNAILAVAETDSAIERAVRAPVPLRALFQRVLLSVGPEAGAKRLRLRAIETSLAAIGDPQLLERILLNLAANAVRYTESGRIVIGAKRRGGMVELRVMDTGIGIGEPHLARIFDDFYQVANPERSRDKGFGLGLSIVHRLCHGMGWQISVRSQPGRGSAFIVTVPAAPASLALEAPSAEAGPEPAETDPFHGLNVLFVDDDPLVRDAMGRTLRSWGINAEIRQSGGEAMAVLASIRVAESWHVFLDHRLAEGEQGLDIATRIQAAHGSRTRITLVTGDVDAELQARAAALGIAILRKPLKPIRLRAALRESQAAPQALAG
jgi:signal transduction histidine kinase/CheY-like chemotaxis protein